MINGANDSIKEKYIPQIEKALAGKSVSAKQAANLLYSVAKQESRINYYAAQIRFGRGARIHTPYEQEFLTGVNLNTSTGELKRQLEEKIVASGSDPRSILEEVVRSRSGLTPFELEP